MSLEGSCLSILVCLFGYIVLRWWRLDFEAYSFGRLLSRVVGRLDLIYIDYFMMGLFPVSTTYSRSM